MKTTWPVLVGIGVCVAQPCLAEEVYRLDPAKSVIQIHLGTAGALRFAGHTHLIQTVIQQGSFVYDPADLSKSSVELTVDAGALRVMDPHVSPQDRSKIQETMQGDRVLDVKHYPQIKFKSSKIERVPQNRLGVTGNLTIRNQTHPVVVDAKLQRTGAELAVVGTSRFKQTTFGMQPVTAGLGTVRVRDEMVITFHVIAQPKSVPGP